MKLRSGKCTTYKNQVRRRIRKSSLFVPQNVQFYSHDASTSWIDTRESCMQLRKMDERTIQKIRSHLRNGRISDFFLLMEMEKQHDRYLTARQATDLFLCTPNIDEYDKVHWLFYYVYDRWNVREHPRLPGYHVCYYGPDTFCDKGSLERTIATQCFHGRQKSLYDSIVKMVNAG